MCTICVICCFFFFNDTATTEIYTLSLHDALPIWPLAAVGRKRLSPWACRPSGARTVTRRSWPRVRSPVRTRPLGSIEMRRSEEHTSELQSRQYLVCRLLLEKKKKINIFNYRT